MCARLHQQCTYAGNSRMRLRRQSNETIPQVIHEPSQISESHSSYDRLSAIEARLEQISVILGSAEPDSEAIRTHRLQQRLSSTPEHRSGTQGHDQCSSNLSSDIRNEGIQLYFQHYCNSPLPLLEHLSADPLSHEFPPIVLHAMLALTLRRTAFSSAYPFSEAYRDPDVFVLITWNSLTDVYRRFTFDESYFQALCLLAQVDYAEGRSERAHTQVALGLRLAQSKGWLSAKHYDDMDALQKRQHQEIVWSLYILDRMLIGGSSPHPAISEARFTLPAYTGGPDYPSLGTGSDRPSNVRTSSHDFMIIAQYARMMCIWQLVAEYINEVSAVDSIPLWHHKSLRTRILTDLLQSEIRKQCLQTTSSSLMELSL